MRTSQSRNKQEHLKSEHLNIFFLIYLLLLLFVSISTSMLCPRGIRKKLLEFLYAAARVAVTNLIPALKQSAFTCDLKGAAA